MSDSIMIQLLFNCVCSAGPHENQRQPHQRGAESGERIWNNRNWMKWEIRNRETKKFQSRAKHVRLYSDLLYALNETPLVLTQYHKTHNKREKIKTKLWGDKVCVRHATLREAEEGVGEGLTHIIYLSFRETEGKEQEEEKRRKKGEMTLADIYRRRAPDRHYHDTPGAWSKGGKKWEGK